MQKLYVPIEHVFGWEKNPRIIVEDGLRRLTEQLKKLGQYKPLVVVKESETRYVVLGGNMRLKAMSKLHMIGDARFEKVWISIVEAPTEAKRIEYALSDNDRAGEYDRKALLDLMPGADFPLADYHVDLGSTISLEGLMDRYAETEEDDFDAAKEAEKITTPTAQRGDIYQLGEHRLMCGDSTSHDDIMKLMGGVQADMCFTDPPYNVNYKGKGGKTTTTILNDHMDGLEFKDFLRNAFDRIKEACKPDSGVYVCYASRTHREFEDSLNAAGYKVKNQIIWAKSVASMGWGDYRWKHEPILYCSIDGKKTRFYGDRAQTTVWEQKPTDEQLLIAARAMLEEVHDDTTVWKLSRDSNYDHPTQKPLQLCELAIKNSSQVGDVVLGIFGGSGSTLMASDQLERKCYTIELDPRFVDVIIKRWQKKTGREALKIS